MRAYDGAGFFFSVGRDPALPKPIGRVEPFGVLPIGHPLSLNGDASQRGVDEGFEMYRLGIGRCQPVRTVDRCVRGNAEEHQLASTGKKDLECRSRTMRWRRARNEVAQQGFELTEAPQRLVCYGVREALIAADKPASRKRLIHRGIKGTSLAQHLAENGKRCTARAFA